MNNPKTVAIILCVTAAISYICAVVQFIRSSSGLGAAWICIGTCFAITAGIWMRRAKNSR